MAPAAVPRRVAVPAVDRIRRADRLEVPPAEVVAVRTVRAGRRLQVTVAERPTLDRVVRHRRLRIREALPMA